MFFLPATSLSYKKNPIGASALRDSHDSAQANCGKLIDNEGQIKKSRKLQEKISKSSAIALEKIIVLTYQSKVMFLRRYYKKILAS